MLSWVKGKDHVDCNIKHHNSLELALKLLDLDLHDLRQTKTYIIEVHHKV